MAGRIPDAFIDDLLARVDIVDLIESYLPLRKAGRDFQALCPFHGEKTPSFTVSREKQFYHCFGCGAHGTAIGFMMNYRNLEFVEAVEELAAGAGIEVPREAQRSTRRGSRELYEVLEKATAVYERNLRQASDRDRAVDYFRGRGITGVIAKQFRLGYAPAGWQNLYDALTVEGISDDHLQRAGLVNKRDHGGCYDRFRDRIIFPIRDRRGRVIAFGGRILDDGEPKYLNSPETEVFHKGRELYGLYESLQAGKPQRLIVVEGYMDVIALHQFGMPNAVATLGTALTADHLGLLFRQVPEVIFCFDGDRAGRAAAWKALEASLSILEGNRQVRFSFLPDGHDPDTAIREFGPEHFFDHTDNRGLSDFLLDALAREVDTSTAEGRARLLARAKPYFNRIPDQAHRVAGAQRLTRETGFDEALVREELGFRARRRGRPAAPGSYTRYATRALHEQALALVLRQPSLGALVDQTAAAFLRQELPEISDLLDVCASAADARSAATLLERFRGSAVEEKLNELASIEFDIDDGALETEMRDAISRLTRSAESRRFQRLTQKPMAQLTEAEKDLLKRYKRGT